MIKHYIFIIFLLISYFAESQTQLNLKSAIDSALKNNFDIRISQNNLLISKNSNNWGTAGALPSVSISVTDNNTLYNNYTKTSAGAKTRTNSVQSNNLSTGISASITLFNGFKISATKERLEYLQKQNEYLFTQQIQNTIAGVMTKYFDIIRQINYLKIMESSMKVSQKKLDIITEKKRLGMSNEADLYQAQIDVNNAEQNLKAQQVFIEQAKTDLLVLMSVKRFYPITIKDTIDVDKTIAQDSVINYLSKNSQLLSYELQEKINSQIIKEITSQLYPTLRVSAGYNLNITDNNPAQITHNQNIGPVLGASLQIPIFNGNIYRTQRKNAIISYENAVIQKEGLTNYLNANVLKTFYAYQNNLAQIEKQKTNFALAEKLIKIVMQRFQANQSTIIDVQTALAGFENTAYLFVNTQYTAKIAEIELKRLTNRLSN